MCLNALYWVPVEDKVGIIVGKPRPRVADYVHLISTSSHKRRQMRFLLLAYVTITRSYNTLRNRGAFSVLAKLGQISKND